MRSPATEKGTERESVLQAALKKSPLLRAGCQLVFYLIENQLQQGLAIHIIL
jgi:hypothetical protein